MLDLCIRAFARYAVAMLSEDNLPLETHSLTQLIDMQPGGEAGWGWLIFGSIQPSDPGISATLRNYFPELAATAPSLFQNSKSL